MRAYCWRVGAVIEYEAAKCPECGSPAHVPYLADDCGGFVMNHRYDDGRGSHCVLARGHDGKCVDEDGVDEAAREVMES